MYDVEETLLYVGKANSLRQRLTQYIKPRDIKTQRLVSQIHAIKLWLAASPDEALLLEHDLIKKHRPKYNILLRVDDKSYPYLRCDESHPYPCILRHRGSRRLPGRYFGPYVNQYALQQSILLLQRLFKIRTCTDRVFANRIRPCMLYQIKRCSAPCVGHIDQKDYQKDVQMAIDCLLGKTQEVLSFCQAKMTEAAKALAYEKAAYYRDLIQGLHQLYGDSICSDESKHCDVIAASLQGTSWLVCVLWVRDGQIVHTHYQSLQHRLDYDKASVLEQYICQAYLSDHARNPGRQFY